MFRTFLRGRVVRWFISFAIILFLCVTQVVAEVGNGHQTFSVRLLLSMKKCQLAVWLTDDKGAFVDI